MEKGITDNISEVRAWSSLLAKRGEHITFKVLTVNAPLVLLSCGLSLSSQNRDTTDSDYGGSVRRRH